MTGVESFKFMALRPVSALGEGAPETIPLESKARVIGDLQSARLNGDRAQLDKIASAFIASDDFALNGEGIDARLFSFARAVDRLPEEKFAARSSETFNQIFSTDPAGFSGGAGFVELGSAIHASLVASMIASTGRARARLVTATRAYWLIRMLARGSEVTRESYRRAAIQPPAGLFPLPNPGLVSKPTAPPPDSDAIKQRAEIATKLANRRRAIDELVQAYERDVAANPTTTPVVVQRTAAAAPQRGFMLANSVLAGLSAKTREIVGAQGGGDRPVDIAKSISLIERGSSDLARELFVGTNVARTRSLLGNAAILGSGPRDRPVLVDWATWVSRAPGPCAPQSPAPAETNSVTVPVGHGEGKVLGIADLLVLEQELLRYELGEIAHIENVLRGEKRERRFKTIDVSEEETVAESETTQAKEMDLASTERFELQTESQEVIAEEASQQAGLTISASYGPSVDATANYNRTSSSSRQESNRAASSFAREVSSRAVERITTRSLNRRTVRTSRTVEERNGHSFDNAGTNPEDIVGTYRFVDKIYKAQVVNYGKRLMLEFVVPEPAAFLRYVVANRPIGDISVIEPDLPGYCIDGKTFSLLQAGDIDPDNYLFWASKYGAQDVGPPPSKTRIASAAKESPDQLQDIGAKKSASEALDVAVPDGYLPQSAYVNLYGETQEGPHKIVWQLQEQQAFYVEPTDDGQLYYLHLQPTSGLTLTLNSLGFYNWEVLVTVFCTLSTEKYQEWQLKTFGAIMNAYGERKSRYDQAIAEARLEAEDAALAAGNPASHRVREQTELKKGCISILTGQRFDLFDAVTGNIAPYGYPEIDFAEAAAEARVIQMFEQSFEWNNMTYLFYPYFWGRKSEWPLLAQLEDNDVLYGRFLSAGAARVQVPVRPGFEDSILSYLAVGAPWDAEGNIIPTGDDAEEQHLSIIDELKSQSGNNNVDGVGALTVKANDPHVAGVGTAFDVQGDGGRRIVIAGDVYVIRSVEGPEAITLAKPFAGTDASGLGYALGGVLIGQPWEIKLPTTLVKLDDSLQLD